MNLNEREKRMLEQVSELLKETVACQYINHTKKVIDYCEMLGAEENANMELLIPAAILHDVGRCKDNGLVGHVEKGLPIAKEILTLNHYSDEKIDLILKAVAEHHVDLPQIMPSTIEGQVLLDADRMEIVGKYGMARWLLSFDVTISPQKACQLWLDLSIRRVAGRKTFFCTDTGEKIGYQNFEFCEKFCKDIING